MKCQCGFETQGSIKYCPKCGIKVALLSSIEKTSIKKCMACGSALTENMKFCTTCGNKIQNTTTQPIQKDITKEINNTTKKIRIGFKEFINTKKKIWIPIAAVLILALAAPILVKYLTNGKSPTLDLYTYIDQNLYVITYFTDSKIHFYVDCKDLKTTDTIIVGTLSDYETIPICKKCIKRGLPENTNNNYTSNYNYSNYDYTDYDDYYDYSYESTYDYPDWDLAIYTADKARVNVRSSPKTGAVIGQFTYLTPIRVLDYSYEYETIEGRHGQWIKVTDGNITGWIFGGFTVQYGTELPD